MLRQGKPMDSTCVGHDSLAGYRRVRQTTEAVIGFLASVMVADRHASQRCQRNAEHGAVVQCG